MYISAAQDDNNNQNACRKFRNLSTNTSTNADSTLNGLAGMVSEP